MTQAQRERDRIRAMSGRRAGAAPPARRRHPVRDFVAGVLPVVGLFTVTRVALAEAYHIPSGSMEPTLLVGDRLVANKLRYGPHVPFTDVTLPGYATPRRGDVVIFESPPQDPSIRTAPDAVTPVLVKRVAGVAGDTLAMRGGRLYVNGVVERPPAGAPAAGAAGAYADEPLPIFAWQRRAATSTAGLGAAPARPTLHDWGPLVVPADAYFMLGDNRDNSVDSRFYGPVPRRNVRGSPTFVYYSYDPGAGAPYVRALTAVRWRRLGVWVR
jgi:signal peptidase I